MHLPSLSRRQLLAMALPLLVAALTACGGGPAPARSGLVARPALNQWPAAVLNAPLNVQAAYRYAVDNPRVLEVIPCHCGCAEQGHRSNLDCYVLEFGPRDAVVLDQHGIGCGGCVGITHDVIQMEAEGQTLAAIRSVIDAKWRDPLPGTDTPLPAS